MSTIKKAYSSIITINVQRDSPINYVSVFFPIICKNISDLNIAHLSEHLLLSSLRKTISMYSSHQYVGAYTSMDYICFYSYDINSQASNTAKVFFDFSDSVQKYSLDFGLLAQRIDQEKRNIKKEANKTIESFKLDGILMWGSDYSIDRPSIDDITLEHILRFIKTRFLSPTIVKIGDILSSTTPSRFEYINSFTRRVIFSNSNLDGILAVKLVKHTCLNDYLLGTALMLYLKDYLIRKSLNKIRIIPELKTALNSESVVLFRFPDNPPSSSVSLLSNKLLQSILANLNLESLIPYYQEAKYRMLLSLDHADTQAMWAFKSFSFYGHADSIMEVHSATINSLSLQNYLTRAMLSMEVYC